jgi:hypothetical protein
MINTAKLSVEPRQAQSVADVLGGRNAHRRNAA